VAVGVQIRFLAKTRTLKQLYQFIMFTLT
jgi:hypothetical protein